MAEDYPVAPARMASLRDKDKNGSEKEKKRWFGKTKGIILATIGARAVQLDVVKQMGCV